MRCSTVLCGVVAATLAIAHPGSDAHAELLERRRFLAKTERSNLSHCTEKLKASGVQQRAIERRKALAQKEAKRGSLIERASSDINKSHHSGAHFTPNTPFDRVFRAAASCVLSPEEIVGPYYVGGEYVRHDLSETQEGIPLWVDIAIVDMDTCEPIPAKWLEVWSCNSTGIYSGVSSGANYTKAPENLDTTFLRGLQKTDRDGAVQFKTLFPGHYSGRTQHIHIIVHTNATERANHTILDATASHVGQMYFDQDLIDEVETYSPYTSNTQPITTNAEDMLLAGALETSDPIMEYVLLGEDISDGLLAWLSFGVNTTLTSTTDAAAIYYAGGGKDA